MIASSLGFERTDEVYYEPVLQAQERRYTRRVDADL